MIKKGLFFIVFLQLLIFKSYADPYQYQLAIVAIFRDEAPYLKEWIEFHKMLGVEHFYLYNNCSTDDYLGVLDPYIQSGDVDLIEWPYLDNTFNGFCFYVQPLAYYHCIQSVSQKVKWLAIIDTDEFLAPLEKDDIKDVLRLFESHSSVGGVVVNWQVFGTSNVPSLPSNKTMIETLVMRADASCKTNQIVKSIVRPIAVSGCGEPHRVNYKPGYYAFAMNGKADGKENASKGPYLRHLVLNHYWAKTEDFCYGEKLRQYTTWNPNYNIEALKAYVKVLNQTRDTTMLRFVAPLRQRLGFD